MYSVSSNYKDYIKMPSRTLSSRLVIGSSTYTDNEIVDMGLESNLVPGEEFSLGTAVCSKFETTLITTNPIFALNVLKPYIGLNINGSVEEVPLGVFNADPPKVTKSNTKIVAYDNMIKFEKAYFSDLTYPATIQTVATEICQKAGVSFSSSLPNYSVDKIEGKTLREAIGVIAGICGGFARINRIGSLEIVSLTSTDIAITTDNFYGSIENVDKNFTIKKITAIKEDNSTISSGSGLSIEEVTFSNNYITQAQLDDVLTIYSNYSYRPIKFTWQGNPAIDVGDKITITDVDNTVYSIPVMRLKLTYKGGLKSEISSIAKSNSKAEYDYKGPVTKKIERLVIEQANIKVLMAEKATIEDLTAINARIDNLSSTYATIINLNAINARVTNLEANSASIVNLNAQVARVDDLYATRAKIVDLDATNGRITTLESRAASIDTLLAGNLTATNMQAGFITAGSGLIANAAIKDAMILNVSADKINAGKINTNLVTIQSNSGNMLISDNTIQIKDASRTRVQIGKDASNDYNMYVWDGSGNLMFDATGLKASGIKSKIIRDDMVSDTANISGQKININSLLGTINMTKTIVDGTDTSIIYTGNWGIENNAGFYGGTAKYSSALNDKIQYTFTGIGINIYFVKSPGSGIAEILIDGVSKGTFDCYAANSTFNVLGFSTNILPSGTHTVNINVTHTKNASATNYYVEFDYFEVIKLGNTSTLSSSKVLLDAQAQTLDVAFTNLSSIVTSQGNTISNQGTSISTIQGQISSKIWSSDITTAINTIQVGGRNLLRDSNNLLVWSKESTVDVIKSGNYYKLYKTATSTGNMGCYHDIDVLPNTQYILSFKVGALNKCNFSIGSFISGKSIWYEYGISAIVAGTNTKIITTLSGETKIRIYIMTPANETDSYVEIKEVKFELGNKATDWTPAPEDIQSQLGTINANITTISDNYTSLNQTVNSISAKVSSQQSTISDLGTKMTSAESSITALNKSIVLKVTQTDIDTSINKIQIGGANLLMRSEFRENDDWGSYWTNFSVLNTNDYFGHNSITLSRTDWNRETTTRWQGVQSAILTSTKAGTYYTVSAMIYVDSICQLVGDNSNSISVKFYNANTGAGEELISIDISTIGYDKWIYVTGACCLPYDIDCFAKFIVSINQNGVVKLCMPKLEEGNKPTAWLPSPMDTQNKIDNVTTRISNAESLIEQNSKSITFKVNTTDFNTLTGRVSTTESSISLLKDQIISKVDSNGVKSIISQSATEVQTAFNGATGVFTIKNGNFVLKNASSANVMWVDTNGSLTTDRLHVYGADNNVLIDGIGHKGVDLNSTNGGDCYIQFNQGSNWARIQSTSTAPNALVMRGSGGIQVEGDIYTQKYVKAHGINGQAGQPLELNRYGGNGQTIVCNGDGSGTGGGLNCGPFYASGNATIAGTLFAGDIKYYNSSAIVLYSHNIARFENVSDNKYLAIYDINGTTYGATIWVSDANLKNSIADSAKSALDEIMRIQHRQFNWNSTGEHCDIGYISQELMGIDPSLVFGVPQENGSMLYHPKIDVLVPIISKAIQELKKEKDAEIASLKEQIDSIKNLLEKV